MQILKKYSSFFTTTDLVKNFFFFHTNEFKFFGGKMDCQTLTRFFQEFFHTDRQTVAKAMHSKDQELSKSRHWVKNLPKAITKISMGNQVVHQKRKRSADLYDLEP